MIQMLLVYLGSVKYLIFIYFLGGHCFCQIRHAAHFKHGLAEYFIFCGTDFVCPQSPYRDNEILPIVHGHLFSDVTMAIQSANIWIQVSSEDISSFSSSCG